MVLEKIKKAHSFGKEKLFQLSVLGTGALMAVTRKVAATCSVQIGDNVENADMDTLMGGVATFVLDLLRWLGVFLLIWGIGQLYLSFRDENSDGKIKALLVCIAAIGLITLKFLLKQMGVITY